MTQKTVPQTGLPNGSYSPAPGAARGSAPATGASPSRAGASGGGALLVTGAHDLATGVKDAAGDVAGEAKHLAESKLDAGKDFAAEHLGTVADALRKTGQELRSQKSAVTEYVEKAASSVESASHYFQTRTLSQLAGDVQSFARREPALFLGGAFFAGLLGGRFLKAATPAPNGDKALPPAGARGARNGDIG